MMGKIIKNNWRKILSFIILCSAALILVINHEAKQEKPAVSTDNKEYVMLSITGEVVKPGTYMLEKGSTLMSAMDSFGGFTPDADASKLDMNKQITKDTTITIKKRPATDNRNYDSLYQLPE